MARDEMATLQELDDSILREHANKIRVYYVAKDGWVGDGGRRLRSWGSGVWGR